LAGWHLATKGSGLSGEHWRKISGALRLSLCMQGRQRSAAEREFRHDVADRPELADGPVNQTPRRPAAEHVGDDCTFVASASQRRPMRR
jgi:hypothetical protein